MTPERWRRIKSVYGEARLRDGSERQQYLDEACGSDGDLRADVDTLLRADDGPELTSPIRRAEDWTGRTLGQFQAIEKVGEGGMGSVWKARDLKLGRNVALKFLAAGRWGDGAQERFLREAQASAALDHPNICPIYGIHEEQGETFIAMAYIDGRSLADRISERPLPLGEALEIAIGIAEGLEAAHEQGVVHRDIKPHNVMLDAKGQVKITDFGLVSLADRSRITQAGTMLGTPAYMAPEQIESGDVDRRTDLWALGCVLYEMLTQRTPFASGPAQAVAFAILYERHEPIGALRSGLPAEVDRIVGKALAKDPSFRYQHADDLLADLRRLRIESSRPAVRVPAAESRDRRRSAAVAALAVLAIAGASFVAGWRANRSAAGDAPPLRRFAIELDHAVGEAVISPNGRYLAYTQVKSAVHGIGSLWLRDLETGQARQLIAEPVVRHVTWSPDSETVAFAAVEPPGGNGSVEKIGVRGGPRIRLWDRDVAFTGGVWSPDGESIVFASRPAALYELPAQGGAPKLTYRPAETAADVGYYHPSWLPGLGRRALVFSRANNIEDAEMMLYRPGSGEEPVRLGNGFSPIWTSGHLMYFGNKGGFWAAPFSLRSLAVTGDAFPVAPVVDMQGPSVADDGALVFVRVDRPSQMQLVWRDRDGNGIETAGESLVYISGPRVSPDGRSIALSGGRHFGDDIWIQTLSPAKATRLTFADGRDSGPIWSPDGRSVLFNSYRNGVPEVFVNPADGASEAKEAFSAGPPANPQDWSRDGRYILYATEGEDRGDLYYVERSAGGWGEPRVFLRTPAAERAAAFSPNGRFVAYVSNESGRDEVYVRPFPSGGGRWQISHRGGVQPAWNRAGSELFFVEGETLMAVAVDTASDFASAEPRPLFRHARLRGLYPARNYDVHPDGDRFVLVEEGANAKASIQIVQNWREEFRRMAGAEARQ